MGALGRGREGLSRTPYRPSCSPCAKLELLPSPCRSPQRTPHVTRRRGQELCRSGGASTQSRPPALRAGAQLAGGAPELEFLCSWRLQGAPVPPRFDYLTRSGPLALEGDEWAVRALANPLLPSPYTEQGHLRALVDGHDLPLAVLERGRQRVVRAGVQSSLEVFWSGAEAGWSVRSLERLARGQFVCEYAGEILADAEAEQRCFSPPGRDAYLFNLTTPRQCRLLGAAAASAGDEEEEDLPIFVVDAFQKGSVGRFLNHACGPSLAANVTPVFVYAEEAPGELPDARLPRVALFANRDVEAGEELRYDYDICVLEADGRGGSLPCCCGSSACRRWVY